MLNPINNFVTKAIQTCYSIFNFYYYLQPMNGNTPLGVISRKCVQFYILKFNDKYFYSLIYKF